MLLEVGDPKIALSILQGIKIKNRTGDIVWLWADNMLKQLPGAYVDPETADLWVLTTDLSWNCINIPNWNFVPLGLSRVVSDAEARKEIENA